jgi:hypothetical protein
VSLCETRDADERTERERRRSEASRKKVTFFLSLCETRVRSTRNEDERSERERRRAKRVEKVTFFLSLCETRVRARPEMQTSGAREKEDKRSEYKVFLSSRKQDKSPLDQKCRRAERERKKTKRSEWKKSSFFSLCQTRGDGLSGYLAWKSTRLADGRQRNVGAFVTRADHLSAIGKDVGRRLSRNRQRQYTCGSSELHFPQAPLLSPPSPYFLHAGYV